MNTQLFQLFSLIGFRNSELLEGMTLNFGEIIASIDEI